MAFGRKAPAEEPSNVVVKEANNQWPSFKTDKKS